MFTIEGEFIAWYKGLKDSIRGRSSGGCVMPRGTGVLNLAGGGMTLRRQVTSTNRSRDIETRDSGFGGAMASFGAGVIGVIFSMGLAYGIIGKDIESNTRDIAALQLSILALTDLRVDQGAAIAERNSMRDDVNDIRMDIRRIFDILEERRISAAQQEPDQKG